VADGTILHQPTPDEPREASTGDNHQATNAAREIGPLRFAYADPPYLGCCKLYDHFHGDDGQCWDDLDTHRQLIARLVREYPDGWALSATSSSLRDLLPLCPPDTRVAGWCKTFGAFKKGVRPAYMWEPVLFWRGRNPGAGYRHLPPPKDGKQNTPKDFHEADALLAPITLRKGFTGAKPESFCRWVLDLLNAQPGDVLDDLFPGTGVMGRVAAEALS
jgi:hypothetical protein